MQILSNIDESLRYLLIFVQCQGQTTMDLMGYIVSKQRGQVANLNPHGVLCEII